MNAPQKNRPQYQVLPTQNITKNDFNYCFFRAREEVDKKLSSKQKKVLAAAGLKILKKKEK